LTPFVLTFNSLNAKLNPVCHLLALLGAHLILHVGKIRVNLDKSHYLKLLQPEEVKSERTGLRPETSFYKNEM
jgi:hypothetical protein